MSKFWMSVIWGGSDARESAGDIVFAVKQKLERLEKSSYSKVLGEFGITLCISGDFDKFKPINGFHSIRIYQKKGLVKFQIVMHQDIWKKGAVSTKKFLHQTLIEAFEAIVKKVESQKISLNSEKLLKDIRKVSK